MKPVILGIVLFAAGAVIAAEPPARVSNITTRFGKTYTDCQIMKVEPDGVSFIHSNGAAKILFEDLPSEVRQDLGYDPKKAEQYKKDLAAKREKERKDRLERQKAVAQAQALAYAATMERLLRLEKEYIMLANQPPSFSYPVAVPATGLLGYGSLSQIQGPYYGGNPYYNSGRYPYGYGLYGYGSYGYGSYGYGIGGYYGNRLYGNYRSGTISVSYGRHGYHGRGGYDGRGNCNPIIYSAHGSSFCAPGVGVRSAPGFFTVPGLGPNVAAPAAGVAPVAHGSISVTPACASR